MSNIAMSPDHVADGAPGASHPSATSRLVVMANQIGRFFAHEGAEQGANSVAQHLEQFWTRKMRAQIVAYAQAGGEGLDALPRAAILRLDHTTAGQG